MGGSDDVAAAAFKLPEAKQGLSGAAAALCRPGLWAAWLRCRGTVLRVWGSAGAESPVSSELPQSCGRGPARGNCLRRRWKMNSKTAKGVIIGKWGLKSGSSRLESDLEKYKQENAALRKSLEEIAKGKGRAEEPERSRLLEVRDAL